MPKVTCQCGCGTAINPINKKGEAARYAHGHNPDGIPTRFQPGHDLGHLGIEARERLGTLRGPGHPHWRGGEWAIWSGYIRVTLSPDQAQQHPTATKHGGGWSIARSHLVWNGANPNDPVQPGEHVHHINHVRDDDRPENLHKLSPFDHLSYHARGRPGSRDPVTGRFVPLD